MPRAGIRNWAAIERMFAAFRHDRVWLGAALEAAESRVLVDDPHAPTAVLLRTPRWLSFLAGTPEPEAVRACLASAMEGQAAGEQELRYISLLSAEWGGLLQSLYGHAFCLEERVAFVWEGSSPVPEAPAVPPEAMLTPIDEELASRIAEEIDPIFAWCWPAPAAFVQRSLGYGILLEGRIVSVAWVFVLQGGEAEIAVKTAPEFQRRGFCRCACLALIRDCCARGLTLHWSAHMHNPPSVAAARAIGFREEGRHLWAHYTPWNAHRQSVSLPPVQLGVWCGEYRLASGRCLYISADSEGLRVQFWSQDRPKHRLYAESDAHFFVGEEDVQLRFHGEAGSRARAIVSIHGEEQGGERSGAPHCEERCEA